MLPTSKPLLQRGVRQRRLPHLLQRAALGVAGALVIGTGAACTTRTVYVVHDEDPAAPVAAPEARVTAPPDAAEPFITSLSPYGQFIAYPGYGRVFVPSPGVVGAGFRPYTNGHWEYTEYGWTWVDHHPFGWATGHYGRWLYDGAYGWVWVPGNVWAPAWVTWRTGGGYVGWAPMPPQATFGGSYGVYDTSWVFVSSGDMGVGYVGNVLIVGPRYRACYSSTYPVRETTVVYGQTYYRGPYEDDVVRGGGRVIHRRARDIDGDAGARGPDDRVVGRPHGRDDDGRGDHGGGRPGRPDSDNPRSPPSDDGRGTRPDRDAPDGRGDRPSDDGRGGHEDGRPSNDGRGDLFPHGRDDNRPGAGLVDNVPGPVRPGGNDRDPPRGDAVTDPRDAGADVPRPRLPRPDMGDEPVNAPPRGEPGRPVGEDTPPRPIGPVVTPPERPRPYIDVQRPRDELQPDPERIEAVAGPIPGSPRAPGISDVRPIPTPGPGAPADVAPLPRPLGPSELPARPFPGASGQPAPGGDVPMGRPVQSRPGDLRPGDARPGDLRPVDPGQRPWTQPNGPAAGRPLPTQPYSPGNGIGEPTYQQTRPDAPPAVEQGAPAPADPRAKPPGKAKPRGRPAKGAPAERR